jgi:hypothetical protein
LNMLQVTLKNNVLFEMCIHVVHVKVVD